MGILLSNATRVIVHGIRSRTASADLSFCIGYGTKFVAGVAPGRAGPTVSGIPVFDTASSAAAELGPIDFSVQYIPASRTKDSVLDALDAGIRTIQLIAEGVTQRDFAYIYAAANEYGARINGPNSNGIITVDQAKVGFIGNATWAFSKGHVGIISRSGGMTHEVAWALQEHGLGVSTALSIGGDAMVGLSFRDVVAMFDEDEDTDVIALVVDPGGRYELELVDSLPARKAEKPIMALLLGYFVESMPRGVSFGHAGALIEGNVGRPSVKRKFLEAAGIAVADSPEELAAMAAKFQSRARKTV